MLETISAIRKSLFHEETAAKETIRIIESLCFTPDCVVKRDGIYVFSASLPEETGRYEEYLESILVSSAEKYYQ